MAAPLEPVPGLQPPALGTVRGGLPKVPPASDAFCGASFMSVLLAIFVRLPSQFHDVAEESDAQILATLDWCEQRAPARHQRLIQCWFKNHTRHSQRRIFTKMLYDWHGFNTKTIR